MKQFNFFAVTLAALASLAVSVAIPRLAVSGVPDAVAEGSQAGQMSGRGALRGHPRHRGREDTAALQTKCCSCGGAFPREVARLCSSCSSKYRSKCCLCSGAFPKDAARLCSSCTSRFRSKCFLCGGAFPKDIARICSSCSSKY